MDRTSPDSLRVHRQGCSQELCWTKGLTHYITVWFWTSSTGKVCPAVWSTPLILSGRKSFSKDYGSVHLEASPVLPSDRLWCLHSDPTERTQPNQRNYTPEYLLSDWLRLIFFLLNNSTERIHTEKKHFITQQCKPLFSFFKLIFRVFCLYWQIEKCRLILIGRNLKRDKVCCL